MSQSLRLGIASIVLVGGIFLGGPFPFACLWLSALLGALAASKGSKWWLAMPALILGSVAVLAVLNIE